MAGRAGVVSFDLDETLWEFMPMMDGALAAAIEELRQREPSVGPIDVAELHRVRAEVAEDMEGTYEELRRESFRRVLAEHGADDPGLSAWMVERWMEARVRTVKLLDDVEPAMDALMARGYLLGAITNGNFPLHRLPLAGRLAFIVHAEHVGEEKPAAAPFARAAELAGSGSERWVHVGDSLESDVLGAQRFGLRAVWLNRRGLDLPEGVHPDAELRSLEALPETVDQLLGRLPA
jgi:FMN hydrolase / 5-amino-6-(5-phospho-D-ribitylamino)uracil phosphatase